MKDKLKKSSELKNSFLILILGCILSTLAVLNSNFVNSHKNQIMLNNEKKQFFDRIISKRYLQEDSDKREIKSKNDTDKVCEKGSQELRDYYKTGDFSKIGIKDDPITCKEKDKEYMKALKKIVKKYIGGGKGKRNLQENTNESNKDDDITESFINYGKHIIPLIIFLVIGILCIPGWLICCFCCCCNCCCCCCCKKSGCKIPCFIFTYVFYALAVAVSIYGLSQSNQIFEGMANTECSFLRFVDELLDGETKETKPKWAGIEGITSILNNIKGILVDLKGEKIGNINTHIENLLDDGSTTTPRNIF